MNLGRRATTHALETKDQAISGSGFAGIVRPARYAGAVAVDDFAIETAGDTTAPSVVIASPADGATLSGVVAVQANASDAVGVTRVEFLVNNQLQATDAAAPYAWNFDTRTVANGSATLIVRAYDAAGNIGSAQRTVAIQNGSATGDAPVIRGTTITFASRNWPITAHRSRRWNNNCWRAASTWSFRARSCSRRLTRSRPTRRN